MPYCLELRGSREGVAERLIDIGALDVDTPEQGVVIALMPDAVSPEAAASAARAGEYRVTPAVSRDAGSVWILRPGPVQVGQLRIVPEHIAAEPGALRMLDGPAFGTGHHPTTVLCLEAIAAATAGTPPEHMLDVGTGSGILGLGALVMGVDRVTALDIDPAAVRIAAANARLNGYGARMALLCGGPDAVRGMWPLVVANVLAAPLIEMAPMLVRRLGHHGRLVLSGIPTGLADDVARAYVRVGLHQAETTSRDGWAAIAFVASW